MNYKELIKTIENAPVTVAVFDYKGKSIVLNEAKGAFQVGSIVGDNFVSSFQELIEEGMTNGRPNEKFLEQVEFKGYYLWA